MVRVKFNVVSEFLEEMQKSIPSITDNILRCTCIAEPTSISPNIRFLFAQVQFICNDRLQDWYKGLRATNEARERANKVMAGIEEVATKAGLAVRKGSYEP